MQEFLEYIVKNLVEAPEDVTITPTERGGATVYELRVNPRDAARVIGRKGSTINAIRSLLVAGSAKQGKRSILELLEDDVPASEDAGQDDYTDGAEEEDNDGDQK